MGLVEEQGAQLPKGPIAGHPFKCKPARTNGAMDQPYASNPAHTPRSTDGTRSAISIRNSSMNSAQDGAVGMKRPQGGCADDCVRCSLPCVDVVFVVRRCARPGCNEAADVLEVEGNADVTLTTAMGGNDVETAYCKGHDEQVDAHCSLALVRLSCQ